MIHAVLIVMGVSGVGKSTIAEQLNTHLHWPFQAGAGRKDETRYSAHG